MLDQGNIWGPFVELIHMASSSNSANKVYKTPQNRATGSSYDAES